MHDACTALHPGGYVEEISAQSLASTMAVGNNIFLVQHVHASNDACLIRISINSCTGK